LCSPALVEVGRLGVVGLIGVVFRLGRRVGVCSVLPSAQAGWVSRVVILKRL
jgi:hypothetical protein